MINITKCVTGPLLQCTEGGNLALYNQLNQDPIFGQFGTSPTATPDPSHLVPHGIRPHMPAASLASRCGKSRVPPDYDAQALGNRVA